MNRRFERKYRLRHRAAAFLRACWEPHLARAPFTDETGSYAVLSQYFDSPDLCFYRRKLDGVGRRLKVRLRTYGYRFEPGGRCFLEIKHRAGESVSKTRLPLPGFHRDWLDPASWDASPRAGLEPFLALRETHRLRPTAQVFYLREAYQGVVEADLRVTFDSHLTGLHPGEAASRALLDDGAREILPPTEVILEVKGRGLLPGWVRDGIRWTEAWQEPVPKYVLAMEALNLVRLGRGVHA